MTMLVAWVGVDQRKPSSLYLAADSRLTWFATKPWDYGRKLFAAQIQPHLLAYCGDVLFPTQAISQIVEIIDRELLFPLCTSSDDCFARILETLTSSLKKYPTTPPAFEILYAAREGSGLSCSFHLHQATFRDGAVQSFNSIPMPSHSDVVAVLGSGKPSFNQSYTRWQKSDLGGTSRAVFSAFADALTNNTDPKSGAHLNLSDFIGKVEDKYSVLFGTGNVITSALMSQVVRHPISSDGTINFSKYATQRRYRSTERHNHSLGLETWLGRTDVNAIDHESE